MIRTSAMSIASLLSTIAFMPEGLGNGADIHGDAGAEEAAIAQITHLSIEEVDARLTFLAGMLGVDKQQVTDTFYDAAARGELPTAEEENGTDEGLDNLADDLLGDDLND